MFERKHEKSKANRHRGSLNNLEETPTASVGLASGIQPSGTVPGGSPGAGGGSIGPGGGSTGGAATGNVTKRRKSSP
jgi:hypothetical protein